MILDKPIYAVDFDGTITKKDNRTWLKNKSYNDYMEENKSVVDYIKKLQENSYIVLWTCRTGKDLKRAIEFTKSVGIRVDAVNRNIVKYKTSRKIMADYYLDDKNIKLWEIYDVIK